MIYAVVIIVVAIALYILATYNSLVTLRGRIRASIQEIGNQLKRQADLIPNLEESTKGYLKHEKEIFKQLTDARRAIAQAVESGNLDQGSQANGMLMQALQGLRVVVESNPQLQASGVVTQLMNELRDTADKVMYSRRTLIDLTADYNIKIATVPASIIANMFGFQPEAGLSMPDTSSATTVTATDLESPKIKLE